MKQISKKQIELSKNLIKEGFKKSKESSDTEIILKKGNMTIKIS